MSLRAQAAADLASILEDPDGSFGWSITLTNPAGATAALTGFSTDHSTQLDPETGQLVSGRVASAALSTASVVAAGIGTPAAVSDPKAKPWLASFSDVDGGAHVYKVTEVRPDKAIGSLVLILEAYEAL